MSDRCQILDGLGGVALGEEGGVGGGEDGGRGGWV